METLLWNILRALRPRIGWLQFTLALAAISCAAVAASSSPLDLPSGRFSWARALGLLLGLWLGRPRPKAQPPGGWRRGVRLIGAGLIVAALLAIGAALVIGTSDTLPPAGLTSQDLAALRAWLVEWWRGQAGWSERPESRAWLYLAAALQRFWAELLAAPNAGERGARLIVLAGGIISTWLGALALGWGLARERNLVGWALPALAAITLTAAVGGGDVAGLVFGLALLLLLTIANGARRRERAWQRAGADFSDEIGTDTLAWGTGAVLLVLLLALALPTSLSNPLATLFWRDVELPSGIAALERNLPRPPEPKAPIGISTLPALDLGESLEQGPPAEPALRVRLGAPLAAGPWPHYWRARVFNFYNGRSWTTNARVGPFEASTINAEALPTGVVQEIDDMRQQREIVVALPDVFAVELDASAERLPDGSLAALTSTQAPTRYRVLSRPQEQASQPRLDAPPPDMSSYLVLPAGYDRVRSLAQVVARGKINQYDQALAIELFLRELPYSYEVQPVPSGGDAVEQFLFDMRQGYCTYYASAMAMLARSLGIPARLAIGYATGEYDQAAGAYLVREADAHAWPELYIDGRWLPFEPTPIRALPARSLDDQALQPQPVPTPEPAAPMRSNGPLIWAAVLVSVAGLSGLGWWLGRPRRPVPLVAQLQKRIEQAGARAGVAWPAGATLQEYGALLVASAPAGAADLRLAIGLIEQARYGGQPLQAEQEGQLRGAAERALGQLARARSATLSQTPK